MSLQNSQHDLVKIAPMAALTGADIGKSSLSSRSAYPDPKSRDENAVLCKMSTMRCKRDARVAHVLLLYIQYSKSSRTLNSIGSSISSKSSPWHTPVPPSSSSSSAALAALAKPAIPVSPVVREDKSKADSVNSNPFGALLSSLGASAGPSSGS